MHRGSLQHAPCVTIQMDDIEALNYDDLEAVAKLSGTNRYKDIIQVRSQETAGPFSEAGATSPPSPRAGRAADGSPTHLPRP